MKESYDEGVANHIGPESCPFVREGRGEALTGVRAGRVWGHEIPKSRVLMLYNGRKARRDVSIPRDTFGPCAVRGPEHIRKHLAREPGGPIYAFGQEGFGGRIEKSEDTSR